MKLRLRFDVRFFMNRVTGLAHHVECTSTRSIVGADGDEGEVVHGPVAVVAVDLQDPDGGHGRTQQDQRRRAHPAGKTVKRDQGQVNGGKTIPFVGYRGLKYFFKRLVGRCFSGFI